MKLTNAEKDAIREEELKAIIDKALENGEKYSAFSGRTFNDGTRISSYIETKYGGFILYCEANGIQAEEFMPIGHIVAYKARQMTRNEVLSGIKALHKGMRRGLLKKEAQNSLEGRVLVAASQRMYGSWDNALKECGIVPFRADKETVEQYTPKIVEMYTNGSSIGKITKEVPLSHHAVRRALVNNGIDIISSSERASRESPIIHSKEEVNKYINELLEASVNERITSYYIKEHNPEMLRSITKYYKTISNAFAESGQYLLDKKVPKVWTRDFLNKQLKLGKDLGLPLNSTYFTERSPSVESFARKEYGTWENALKDAGVPLEYVRTSSTEFAKLGNMFEDVLRGILNELGYEMTENTHDRWCPDFVIGDKWVDAKLSEYTYLGKDDNGLTVIDKYEPYCEELELVFLRGNRGTCRKLSEKTTLVHVSKYVNKLPTDRQEHYNDILTQIEREANSIEYDQGA